MPSNDDEEKPLSFSAKWIPLTSAGLSIAFVFAVLGSAVTVNKQAGTEGRWTVSRVIGGEYPERPLFQFIIAIVSGPRIALVAIWYLLLSGTQWPYALELTVVGALRVVTGGLFTYVPINDDHGTHDLSRVLYAALGLVWMVGLTKWSRDENDGSVVYKRRRFGWIAYIVGLALLTHYYSAHKLYGTPGAYEKYCFIEWILIMVDLVFDGLATAEFGGLALQFPHHGAYVHPRKGKLAFV